MVEGQSMPSLRVAVGVAGAVAVLIGAPVAAQDRPAVTVSLNGRMQFQWNSTSVDTVEAGTPTTPIPSSTFETRRVRLEANVTVEEWIRGMVEADFALGRLVLKQVWMSLQVDPALVVRAGQFKKPFSLIELRSSTQNAVIERGVRIRNLEQALAVADPTQPRFRNLVLPGEEYALLAAQNYMSYDMGVELSGAYGALGWAAGVFNGTGADARDENNAKQLAARVTVAPQVGKPLRLGAGVSHSEMNFPAANSPGRSAGNAVELDAELGGFRNGLWVLAEATGGRNLATDGTFRGAQGVVSYFLGTGTGRIEGVEPVARVSWGDPDDDIDDDAGLLVTPGINLYFFGRNRLMFNWDIYMAQNDAIDTHYAGRAQINLHF
jgi:hypothetical protein